MVKRLGWNSRCSDTSSIAFEAGKERVGGQESRTVEPAGGNFRKLGERTLYSIGPWHEVSYAGMFKSHIVWCVTTIESKLNEKRGTSLSRGQTKERVRRPRWVVFGCGVGYTAYICANKDLHRNSAYLSLLHHHSMGVFSLETCSFCIQLFKSNKKLIPCFSSTLPSPLHLSPNIDPSYPFSLQTLGEYLVMSGSKRGSAHPVDLRVLRMWIK